MTGNDLSLLN